MSRPMRSRLRNLMILGLLVIASLPLAIMLVQRKLVTDKQGRKIMRGAVQTIIDMDIISPNIALKAAHEVLAGQIDGWEKAAKNGD